MSDQFDDRNQADDDSGVTRRRLLRLGLLAAGASAVAIPAGTLRGYSQAAAAELGGAGRTASPTAPFPSLSELADRPIPIDPAVAPAHLEPIGPALPSLPPRPPVAPHATAPAPAVPQPTWLSTWNRPVYQLDEFLARSKTTHMPRNAIMLTIDDGPQSDWTPKYLRLLAKYHVQATFCMIGRQVKGNAALVKAVASEGHHIANHTFNHPLSLPKLSAARVHAEMEDTNDAIVRASGFRPRQFRAPGGNWGPEIMREAAAQEMLPLGWDIDPRDWSRPGVAHIKSAMLASRPHDIILCHDGGGDRSETFAALTDVIPALLSRGWTFVTLPAPQTL